MSRSTLRTALLLSLAVPTVATGAWALAAPASWHGDFPGFGRDWLPVFGAYNEHLARDYGGALLALGVVLAWTALASGTSLRRVAPAAFLFFAAPHLAFHLAHVGDLPAGDDVANLVLLTLSVVIPVALLLLSDEGPIVARGPSRASADGWRLSPAPNRNPLTRLAYRASRRRFGHVIGPLAVTAHSPPLLAGYSILELALERCDRVNDRLKELAAVRAATMTGCPFCIDFGSAFLARSGGTARQLREITGWRDSDAFSEEERLVLEYAEAMTSTPVQVSDELFDRLRARYDEAAIVELTGMIAVENYRARFNHAVGLGSEGFCELPVARRPAMEAVA